MVTASIEAYYKVETSYPSRAMRFFLFPFVSFPFLYARVFPLPFLHLSTSASLALAFIPLCRRPSPSSRNFFLLFSPSHCISSNFPVLYFPRLLRPNLFTLMLILLDECFVFSFAFSLQSFSSKRLFDDWPLYLNQIVFLLSFQV